MAIAIIPKDRKAMKKFVNKTQEWIEGYMAGKDEQLNDLYYLNTVLTYLGQKWIEYDEIFKKKIKELETLAGVMKEEGK